MKHSLRTIGIFLILVQFSGCTTSEQRLSDSPEGQMEILLNPTIDLFGVISQLAEDKQYTEFLIPRYNQEVVKYFEAFKDHPSIHNAKEYKNEYQINGDAPMSLAVYIGPPPELEPKFDISNLPASFDPRWDSTLISNYLENARLFAVESNFLNFLNTQKEFKELARGNLRKMIKRVQIFQWYKQFFGYYPDNFTIYLALQNGSCNYGYPVTFSGGKVEFVSVLGARFPDNNGIPTYPEDWYLPVIIHEFTHSYINPLIARNQDMFKALGEAFLYAQSEKMNNHGYSVWNVIIQEYVVRACTIKYLEQNLGKRQAKKYINNDIKAGFTEIRGLVKLFDDYEDNRERFDNIEAFLPEIKKYFENHLHDLRNE